MNQISKQEELAVKEVLKIGAQYGYGNLIASIAREWAEILVRQGLDQDTAIKHVSNRSPYPLFSNFPYDRGFRMEEHKE